MGLVASRRNIVFALLVCGCGGSAAPPIPDTGGGNAPGAAAHAPPPPSLATPPALPLGACSNTVDYSDRPSDATTLHARFAFDARGLLVSYLETTGEGAVRTTVVRALDAAGRVRTEDESVAHLGPPSHASYTYRPDGALASAAWLTDASALLTRFSYDAAGQLARRESFTDGVPSYADAFSTSTQHDGTAVVTDVTDYPDVSPTTLLTWFANGRWLTKLEMWRDGKLEAREEYTYSDLDAGELSGRDFDGDGDGVAESYERFVWRDHRLVSADYEEDEGAYETTMRLDFTYDDRGRLAEKKWAGQGVVWRTTIAWTDAGLDRVVRTDVPTGQQIERWQFAYGCPAGRDMNVPIAPVVDWQRELETIPFVLERAKMWGPPAVL